ncbi:glycosyltransferase family 2 protein [Polynucleobacter sp.]|uniref:glycosyltransferase family 2 protein n=1 Tax=Polynucleobacter sp. TaxID=2029855 RepID=UPI0027357408|nr:glycosyltransferase family 2 protein [Polynucleobacter sp.]MDP3122714.1 glycosyltransferase family 2 protein [Polynucleobacter sp.]
MSKLISILTPCFNESGNVEELYARILSVIEPLKQYEFEIIFIDNSSEDDTVEILRKMATLDKRIKVIINQRNFGYLRSPYWGMMQTSGEATIAMSSDLQDPPELIPSFLAEWEKGWKVVLATKPVSYTNPWMHLVRRTYYHILDGISDIKLVKDATGFGLYDKVVLDQIRNIADPYPYLRGMICEFGYPIKTLPFEQPRRRSGISKNNFYILFDLAMLGIVSHSILPLRLATFFGLGIGLFSFLIGVYYLVMKLVYWDSFSLGLAPLVVGFFFINSFLFIFIGLLGEYIGSLHTFAKNRPVVIEKERINF